MPEKKEKRKNSILISVVILLAAFVVVFAISSATDHALFRDSAPNDQQGKYEEDEVVARVNGEEIKGTELNAAINQVLSVDEEIQRLREGGEVPEEELNEQAKDRALDNLVSARLIFQHISVLGFEVTEDEIDTAYQQIIDEEPSFQSEEDLLEVLRAQNITPEELKKEIKQQILLEKFLKDREEMSIEPITEEELQFAYDALRQETPELPPLNGGSGIRGFLEQEIAEQRLLQQINSLIEQLRDEADIEILV